MTSTQTENVKKCKMTRRKDEKQTEIAFKITKIKVKSIFKHCFVIGNLLIKINSDKHATTIIIIKIHKRRKFKN